MNWEAIGSVAELVGAFGVIVSLLYLAKQIGVSSKQTEANSSIARGTAYQQVRMQVNDVLAHRLQDPALDSIWRKGLDSRGDLTPEEKSRFDLLIFMTVGNWESVFHLRDLGIIDESMGSSNRILILRSAGFRDWWCEHRQGYSEQFRDHISMLVDGDA